MQSIQFAEGAKTIAIIQARMGSTRLPGKSLLKVAGAPLVAHVARRASAAQLIDKVVFAIPDTPENDVLEQYIARELCLAVYRGSDDDVLDRFASAIIGEQPDIVARITADDPLKDPALIDQAVDLLFRDPGLTYASNSLQASYPEGLDVEVVRASALLEAAAEATLQMDREHVTPFVWRQPDRYRLAQFHASRDFSSWRWTLDTREDFEFLDAVLASLPSGPEAFGFETVVELIEATPALFRLMPNAPRSMDKLDWPDTQGEQ